MCSCLGILPTLQMAKDKTSEKLIFAPVGANHLTQQLTLLFFFSFPTRFHRPYHGLTLIVTSRLTLNSWSSYLHFPVLGLLACVTRLGFLLPVSSSPLSCLLSIHSPSHWSPCWLLSTCHQFQFQNDLPKAQILKITLPYRTLHQIK